MNNLIEKALFHFFNYEKAKIDSSEILEILSENCNSDCEDSQDYRRKIVICCICYTIIYLTVPIEHSVKYLENAKVTLQEGSGEPDFGIESEYAGFLVLKLVVTEKDSESLQKEIRKIEKFAKEKRKVLETRVYKRL